MAIITYETTAEADDIIAWELARRATASATPPKDAQALFLLEIGHLIRTWQSDRKGSVVAKLQADPTTITAADKTILGIR